MSGGFTIFVRNENITGMKNTCKRLGWMDKRPLRLLYGMIELGFKRGEAAVSSGRRDNIV